MTHLAKLIRLKNKAGLFIFLISLVPTSLLGQDLSYAKEVVKTLASDEFKGRGYVQRGDALAADYIRSEFERIGLEPIGKSYFQKFSTSVNTFPGTMDLSLNGEKKTPGTDYLIEVGSPSIKGEFETVILTAEDINDGNILGKKLRKSTGKFIIIPTYNAVDYSKDQQKLISNLIDFIKFHANSPAAGSIILTKNKLTWGASTVLNPKPSFTVVSDDTQEFIEKITVNIENKFYDKYLSQNVIGMIEGERSDSTMVFVAHYDHLGMMGEETVFPGANDNASGVAMLLNLATHYQKNQPRFNTVFIAFGGEELGLLGAQHFVENPLIDLAKIRFLLNFDISGTGDEGIQIVNGSVYQEQFDLISGINDEQSLLTKVKIRGEACNSDHCLFYMKKVPCFFIYTLGGIQAYHDIYDKPETLPLTEFENYFKLIVEFVRKL